MHQDSYYNFPVGVPAHILPSFGIYFVHFDYYVCMKPCSFIFNAFERGYIYTSIGTVLLPDRRILTTSQLHSIEYDYAHKV